MSKEDFIFDTYDKMIHNNTLNENNIKLVSKLIQLISAKKLKMVDPFSLYYNKNNKLVFLYD
jgi:hypothetical protein